MILPFLQNATGGYAGYTTRGLDYYTNVTLDRVAFSVNTLEVGKEQYPLDLSYTVLMNQDAAGIYGQATWSSMCASGGDPG